MADAHDVHPGAIPQQGSPQPAAPATDSAAPKKAPGKAKYILAVVAVIAAVGGGLYYHHSLSFEDTDDAQIDGDISAISPRVSGTVKSILVVENQHVNAGELLAEIDPVDFEVAVAQAKAAVAQADAQLRAEQPAVDIAETSNGTLIATSRADVSAAQAELGQARASVKQADAQLVQAQATEKLAHTELDRAKALIETGAISAAERDTKVAAADAAQASVVAAQEGRIAARDRVAQAAARVTGSSSRASEARQNAPRQLVTRQANVEIRKANLDLAQAQLRQAELNLSYTKVIAPVSGVVGKKSVNVGDRVQPGQQLLAITQVERLWVTANFRETQLKHVRKDQSVEVHVDALDLDLHGTVESVGGATGARYSLLPPENATGNYVKVVQRIPVRIRIEPNQAGLENLRPGLSVEPKVRVK